MIENSLILNTMLIAFEKSKKFRVATAKQLQKFPKVSNEILSETANHIRNYVVFAGSKYANNRIDVHVGLGSNNHLETIKSFTKNEPILYVLLDNRNLN